MSGSAITQSVSLTRLLGTPQDMIRKAHAVLADRFAPAKVRHKPLSILRQEARRALEGLFDADFPVVKKPERDRMIEDVLGEAAGFGPLEELFRDEMNKEVMVLAANQVIARRADAWTPTSVRFRDPAHLRGYLQRLADTAEAVGGPAAVGGFDVRLANGFRVIGVLPPTVLDQPPLAVFVRGEPGTGTMPALPRSGMIANPPRAVPDAGSTGVPAAAAVRVPIAAPPSGRSAPKLPPLEPAPTADPYRAVRQRVAERIVRKCAAAGVYDLGVITTPELQRIILAHVEEMNATDRLGLDAPTVQRLTLEILAGMNR